MKKQFFGLFFILFCTSMATAQKNSIQFSPVAYQYVPYSQIVSYRIHTSSALYYQREISKKVHLVGGAFYMNRYMNDWKPNCFDCSSGTQDLRQLAISIAPKYYFLNPKNRWQPYAEVGANFSFIKSDGHYENYAWGSFNQSYNLTSQGAGLIGRLGLDFMITKNLFCSINSFLNPLQTAVKKETIDHLQNIRSNASFTERQWNGGHEFRIGYKF